MGIIKTKTRTKPRMKYSRTIFAAQALAVVALGMNT